MSATLTALRLEQGTAGALAVHGALDFASAGQALPDLRAAIAAGSVHTLDLSGVTHGDSAGLACLLVVMADAARAGQSLQLQGLPQDLSVLAQVCGVGKLLA